jgi:hypothetical protein
MGGKGKGKEINYEGVVSRMEVKNTNWRFLRYFYAQM